MFLNIITPSKRPKNLHLISDSIKRSIPEDKCRWIVVIDSDEKIDDKYIPDNCEVHYLHDDKSVAGFAQRNFAINLVTKGHIFFLDDDTTVEESLWSNVNGLSHEFIHFYQYSPDKSKVILDSGIVDVFKIDIGGFIVSERLAKKTRFRDVGNPLSDSIFAKKAHERAITKKLIKKPLSIYNSLRKDAEIWSPTVIKDLEL